jgi:hypothetical protein
VSGSCKKSSFIEVFLTYMRVEEFWHKLAPLLLPYAIRRAWATQERMYDASKSEARHAWIQRAST